MPGQGVTQLPASARELLTTTGLEFLLEDEKVPSGFIRLFGAFISRQAALTNLTSADIDWIIEGYGYCRHIYQMQQRQPKAMLDTETKEPLDSLQIIQTQFEEDIQLEAGKYRTFIQLKRSKDGENMRLMAPHPQPPTQSIPEQKRPSMWARVLGRK